MPSNIFLYQLPKKQVVENGDTILLEDNDGTKTITVSAFRDSIFSGGGGGSPLGSGNFRIKNGNTIQLMEMQGANAGKFKTVVSYNGTLALSGAYET